jgi:3-phosphoshikimate 1-carboxyvinyltransferase
MRISVRQSEVKGTAVAPSSKSYTIRGLMCAALADGCSELCYPLISNDTMAAIKVLNNIGVRTDISHPDYWKIDGGRFMAPSDKLFCGESAATLRFMSAICALVSGTSRITAGPTLAKRPFGALLDALKMWGVDITSEDDEFPIVIHGGMLKGGHTELPGNISSQYVSALLLIASRAAKRTRIWLTTPLESRSYVLMTLECLKRFGIEIQYSEELMEYETFPQGYRPTKYNVEGDWSSASYLLGLGAVAGEIIVENLNPLSLQGDKRIVEILRNMGSQVKVDLNSVRVRKDRLKAVKVDLNECIDLLPTVAVLAALADGITELTGIRRARLKESDRISAIRDGLDRMGIRVLEAPDKLIIIGGEPQKASVNSFNDHRIAMAFSLIGAACGNIILEGAECVSKTYPEYWQTIRKLGVTLDEQ